MSKPTNVLTELSIEETNKIRIAAGLKPLKVDTPKPKETSITTAAEQEQQKKTDDLENTILQLKKKRESKPVGKSIAEQLIEDNEYEDQDASSWIQKSREKAKQAELEKKARLQQQQKDRQQQRKSSTSASSSSIKEGGIKVSNKLNHFEDGDEHILVLEDSNVLDENGEDVLMNVRVSEQEKREKLIQGSKKTPTYDRFDPDSKSDILSQYDQLENDKKNSIGFTIGSNGAIADVNKQQNNNDDEEMKKKLDFYSYELDTSSAVRSSFYTKEEMEKFKKPSSAASSKKSSSSNGEKKKKKLRKKTESVLEELDATTSSDLGSRKTRGATSKDVEMSKQLDQRESNYQKALEKSSKESKIVYNSDMFEEAEDVDFYKSLASAKKAPILEKKIVEKVSDIVNKRKQEELIKKENSTDLYDDSLVINSTTEFARGLKSDGVLSNFKPTIYVKSEENDDQDSSNIVVKKEIKVKGEDNSDDEKMRDNDDEEDEDENMDDEDTKEKEKELAFIIPEEPMVSSSMSAALRVLAQKGELQTSEVKKKRKGINFDDEETIIEHKDEFGRVMNRKEAFVYLSQKFHGKKSGKNKQEKRLKMYQEEMKQKQMNSSDTPLNSVKTFQSYQQQTHQPYLVLSGSGSTIQSEIQKVNQQKSISKGGQK
eukprot:gene6101-7601_t